MINLHGLFDLFKLQIHPPYGVLRERSLLALMTVEKVDGRVLLRVELRQVMHVCQ
jgi:hypothetical protein